MIVDAGFLPIGLVGELPADSKLRCAASKSNLIWLKAAARLAARDALALARIRPVERTHVTIEQLRATFDRRGAGNGVGSLSTRVSAWLRKCLHLWSKTHGTCPDPVPRKLCAHNPARTHPPILHRKSGKPHRYRPCTRRRCHHSGISFRTWHGRIVEPPRRRSRSFPHKRLVMIGTVPLFCEGRRILVPFAADDLTI